MEIFVSWKKQLSRMLDIRNNLDINHPMKVCNGMD